MTAQLTLISHTLCPYVQRAVISLAEKNVPFERIDIDLADKPDWFLRLSPLGKTPVLKVGDKALFDSSVILEYLEDTAPPALHPADPLERADHRAWIEFGSAVLNGIARLYNAADAGIFENEAHALRNRFAQLEHRIVAAPYFDGSAFSLVDSVYGPVFRYFDIFDQLGITGIIDRSSKVSAWRGNLARRPSVAGAVAPTYASDLRRFLNARGSYISELLAANANT
ncbi:glutathione S-transferase family protein [Nisaea sp.]|uniref:glutathione S-transferase family protein n=1 Tax=Nisaea sp. TaxID=2024842 RepID=UPI0032EB662B